MVKTIWIIADEASPINIKVFRLIEYTRALADSGLAADLTAEPLTDAVRRHLLDTKEYTLEQYREPYEIDIIHLFGYMNYIASFENEVHSMTLNPVDYFSSLAEFCKKYSADGYIIVIG